MARTTLGSILNRAFRNELNRMLEELYSNVYLFKDGSRFITRQHIAYEAIDELRIADDSVGNRKLKKGGVHRNNIADRALYSEHFSQGAVTWRALSSDVTEEMENAISKSNQLVAKGEQLINQNENVQEQIDTLVAESGTSDAEVLQARGGYNVLRERLDEEFNFITNYNEFPQSPRPSKQGFMNNSTKFFRKTGESAFELIQKANKGYLKYTFNTVGGGNDPSDAGGNHELIRLKKVEVLTEFYMYYDITNPVSGSLTVRREPGSLSEVETNLLRPVKRKDDNSVSSKSNKHGIGTYVLSPNSEVEYELPLTSAKKMNIVILGSNQSSNDVDVMINDSSVVNINASSFNGVNDTTSYSYAVIEFPVPTEMRANHSKVMKLRIKNNSVDKDFLFSALNFCELSNWKNEKLYVNNYKGFGTSYEPFIDAQGASDYALQDGDGLYYGSYHGGEKLTYSQCNWPGEIHEYTGTQNELISFGDVPVNEWRLINNFKIIQRTNIDNQAEMLSEFNFDIDGTLEMSFGFYNEIKNILHCINVYQYGI